MSNQQHETRSTVDEASATANDGAAISEAPRSTSVEPAAVGADENPPGETDAAAAPSEPADGLHGAQTAASDAGAPTATPDLPVLQDTLSPLVDLAGNGGPVLLVLAAMSIAALTIVLAKLWQFARLRVDARQPVETALERWHQDDPDAALQAIGNSRQPSAILVVQAINGLQAAPAQSADGLELLREELTRSATAQLEQLRSWLRALEVIATLSPLLGLLGTVLGMIEAFRQLAAAGSQVDPALLSGGIWQALLTTAAGLSVAIPVVLLHSWLERRVERCAHRMEDAVTRIFTRPLHAPARAGDSAHGRPQPSALTANPAAVREPRAATNRA
jgi:biopolymer transport protein ExbB